MDDVKFPVVLKVQVAWAEMDAFGHVNNTVHLRWFESARIRYFEELGVATTVHTDAKSWPLLVHSAVDYKSKVLYPDTIEVGARVTKLGTTSFSMAYRATSQQQAKIVAEGIGVIVMVDAKTGAKVPLDDLLRSRVQALEGL